MRIYGLNIYDIFFRLKGNVNWQENANKNVIDTKLQEARYVNITF